MSYKLKDIFLESDSKTDEAMIKEGLLSDLFDAMKDLAKSALRGFVSRGELAQIDKMIGILRKMREYGIKDFRGMPIAAVIRELEREKRLLSGKELSNNSSKDALATLRKFTGGTRKSKSTTPRVRVRHGHKNQTPAMNIANSLSLREIFESDLLAPDEEPVQNNDNPEYNETNSDEKTALESEPKEKPVLSDEEILAGLRDDVASYGEYDPVLGNSDGDE